MALEPFLAIDGRILIRGLLERHLLDPRRSPSADIDAAHISRRHDEHVAGGGQSLQSGLNLFLAREHLDSRSKGFLHPRRIQGRKLLVRYGGWIKVDHRLAQTLHGTRIARDKGWVQGTKRMQFQKTRVCGDL